MKNLLFIALLLVSMCSNAQNNYESNIKVRFDAGVDSYKNHSFGMEYIGGFRLNPKTRIGFGTGISWVNQLYRESIFHSGSKYTSGYYTTKNYEEDAAFVPLFINGKFNFVEKGVSPFLNVNFGYSFFIPCSDYAKNNHHSLFFNPSFGIDVPLSKGAMTFELGYKYQMRKVDENALSNMGQCNYSQAEIAVGYQF